MLDAEIADVNTAKTSALQDSTDYKADLDARMARYETDRIGVLNSESDKVLRVLNRALAEGKPVDEVFYALRLDWLQGVYIAGTVAYYDNDVYDMSVFDTEYDIFTYDMGHGKGHGHRNGNKGPGNDRDQGFVTGRGGVGDISQLNGVPTPADGKRGRYDSMTQSGHGNGMRPSDYEIGVRTAQADGAYNYNQAADLGVQGSQEGVPRRAPKRRAPKRRPTRRSGPKRATSSRPVKGSQTRT